MSLIELQKDTSSFLKRDHQLFIGGKWRGASSGSMIDVVNPADGKKIGQFADATEGDIDAAVDAARSAFDTGPWPQMKPAERANLMQRIADKIEAHAEELAQLETLDNGKPIKYAHGDVAAAIGAMRYYAGWADKIHGTTHNINLPGDFHTYTLREPVGVVALIVPWNYPMVMAAMKLGPALAAGCTCILKPAEDTSLSALRLGELFAEAGLPEGVLNIVTGYGRTAGAALAKHKGINKIAFTGSTATGKAIAQIAAADLKKVSLELGGKSPNILFEDANLEKAIPASAMGIFFNSGQTCTAPSRIYVHKDIQEQVIQGISDFAANLKIGPGLDDSTDLGPLVSQRQFDRVSGYLDKGREEGARIASGGQRVGDEGYFLQPTVIAQTRNDMTIVREEIFGPVVAVQSFETMDEALALANDNEYGLAGAVWTENLSRAHMMAKKIQAGIIGINTVMGADWDVPLGGYKQSGIGRENGFEGLSLYLNTKSVFAAI